MVEETIEDRSKLATSNENPTAPVLGFSCYAFADHSPSTRLSGQQNKNPRTESVGLREEVKGNNKNKIQRTKNHGDRKRQNTGWQANVIEIHVEETACQEMGLRLEEVARAIYEYSCQLVKFDIPLESTEAVSPPLRRTGTDG